MAENKVNWNTILVVLVVGVVGILLLNNGNLFSGRVTGVTSKIGNIDKTDKQTVLNMLNSCIGAVSNAGESCTSACTRILPGSTCVTSQYWGGVDSRSLALPVACSYASPNIDLGCRCCSS